MNNVDFDFYFEPGPADCARCGSDYYATKRGHLYCQPCGAERKKEYNRKYMAKLYQEARDARRATR